MENTHLFHFLLFVFKDRWCYLDVPDEIWLGMILIEHIVKKRPIQFGFDALATFPQHDWSILVLVELGTQARFSLLEVHREFFAHFGLPMLHGHINVLFRDLPRLFRVLDCLFRDHLCCFDSRGFGGFQATPCCPQDHIALPTFGIGDGQFQIVTHMEPIYVFGGSLLIGR